MQNQLKKFVYLERWITLMMIIKKQFKCYSIIQYWIHIVNQIQTIITITNNKSNNEYQNLTTLIYGLYISIIRPEIGIINYIPIEIIFIVTFIIVILHKLFIGLLLYKFQNYFNTHLTLINQLLLLFVGIYQQTIYKFLGLFLQTICFMQIQKSQEQIQYNILSWIIICIIQIDIFIALAITESPLTYKILFYEKRRIFFSTLLSNVLKLLSHILYFIVLDDININQILLITSIITILISLVEIVEQLQEQIYIYKQAQIIVFVINIFNILYAVKSILRLATQNESYSQQILLIQYPILLYLVININKKQDSHWCQSLYSSPSIILDKFQYSLINSLNQISENQSMILIQDALIFLSHKQFCQNSQCICHTTSYYSEVSKIAPLTIQMRQQFYKKKLKQLSCLLYQSVQGSKAKLLEQVINHSIMQYDFGLSIAAIKTLNSILISDSQSTYFSIAFQSSSTVQTKIDTNTLALSNNSETAELRECNFNFKVNLSLIQRIKIRIIISIAKCEMKNLLSQSFYTYSQNVIIDYLQKFLTFEFQMDDIKTLIIQLAQQKVNYYQKLNQDNSFNLNNMLQMTRDTCNQMITTNKILRSKFSDFPCLSIQNAICYYESEISNNYHEARKVSNQTSMSDEKFLMFNSNLISNKDKIGYLLIEISNDFQQTEIKFASNQFQKLFEKKHYDQKLKLDDLLPKFLIKYHPSLMQSFLTTGHSKFFQNFQLNFLNTKEGLIKGVRMCYDLTKIANQQDQLIFAVFFQELSDSKAYVLVDGITKYCYFSECFLKKLGFQDHEIKFIESSNILLNLSITYLLPEYDTLIDIDEQEIRLQGVDLYFANVFRLFSTIFTEKKVQNSSNTFSKIAWHRKDKLFKYSVNLQITRRQFKEFYYIIIEILSIEANSQTNIIDSINRIECQDYLQKNQCSISEKSESYSSGQINFQYQDVPNKVEVFQGLKNEFILSRHYLDSVSQPRITICEPGRIVTPNESSSYTKRKFHSKNQQQFYSQKMSQADIQALISEKKLDIPYDEEQQQQLKMEQLSDKSSIEDEQKKKFMKKFELVQKLMVYKRPLKLIEILSLLTLQNILFTIFSLIAITVMFNDLSQVLKEIDTISLHSSIMVKHDIFFSIRATIKIYQEYQKKTILLNVTSLISPFYYHLAESYLDYQNDLYNQFQNRNLQPYLDDYYLIIYQLESLNNQQLLEKNVTVREALMVNLQYEFAVLDAYLNQKDISNSTFQVFLFTNFVKLHQYLEDLTKNLLFESTNRSLSVANKWMIIWIFFQIGALVLAIFNFYCYYHYITFYDKFLLALKFIDTELITQEIERYKEIIKKLKDNSRYVFEYKIDLDQIQQSKTNKRQLSIKNKEIINKKVIKLRRFSSFMLIFVLNLIFGGYSAIINEKTQIYLNKYEKTANLFKLFQDLSLSGGNCFLYKEILLGFNNYTFYFQEDRGNMYKMLFNSLDSIQEYLNLSNSLDFNTYLATDSFIILFNDLKTNSLCSYFSQEYLYPYCQLSFDGVLSQGLVSSLNYVQNTIKTQQAINNFTFKTDYNLYEQEGSQIITRAFLNMSLTFKEDLTLLTQNQTDLAYNLSIAFFIYSFIVTFCLLFYLKQHLTNEYYIIRRIISLIPINVLMFDETLDRYLREIALHQELL